jgi:nucleoside-diphosphate-sugar epimerase
MTRSIAILGHRGWVAAHVIKALLKTEATLKVIHRPGSSTSDLPETVQQVEASLDDEDALVNALRDVDIAM